MNHSVILLDIRQILTSKRAIYTIAIMAIFALIFSLVVEFSPESLKAAMEASMPPGSAGVFEYVWFSDVMLFLLLAVVSFGAFIISDLDDDGILDITLARPEGRYAFLLRRTLSILVSFVAVFLLGTVLAGAIAAIIVGGLDYPAFLAHHIMLMPMLLFVIALTFFVSVPLRNVTYTVLAGFSIPLALSLTHMFMTLSDPGAEPSILNPMAYPTRVFTGMPLGEAAVVALVLAIALFMAGAVWFGKKDI
jgi:ABC-type transport system involved in multi-copper enzyme maturation permease subunit